MTGPWAEWNHVVKIDPDKTLPGDETFGDVCATGTDAIAIGGTTGMTEGKIARVLEECAAHGVALYQEPSSPGVVVEDPALDGYLIPTVMNADDSFWVTGAHKEWVRSSNGLDWSRTWSEAYVVLNPESDVARYTGADCDQAPGDVAAYATVAERLFGQGIVYLEYSGTLGDPDVLAAAADALDEGTLFYGGGIDGYESARRMAEYADVVVVGDLVHDRGAEAVRETVEGAGDA